MKTFLSLAASVLALIASAANGQRFQQEANIIYHADRVERVWIGDADKSQILYYTTERGVDVQRLAISKAQSIWLMEPPAYTAALEAFQGRRYEEALEGFQAVSREYEKLYELPDNHGALAYFYSMECLRKLERLEELSKAVESINPAARDSLTRPYHKTQFELYAMWDAIRTKSWDRVELIANERLGQKLPGFQRAQAGYGLGLALEGQGKTIEAINAYDIAMTADSGTSEVVAKNAAENAMRLYLQDEGVKLAQKLYGTPDEDPRSQGAARLNEAVAVMKLYEISLGGGEALPGELAVLKKYSK